MRRRLWIAGIMVLLVVTFCIYQLWAVFLRPPWLDTQTAYWVEPSPDGERIAVSANKGVEIRRIADQHLLMLLTNGKPDIGFWANAPLTWNRTSTLLATATWQSNAIYIWSMTDTRPYRIFHRDEKERVLTLRFSLDQQDLYVLDLDGTLQRWNVVDGRLVQEWQLGNCTAGGAISTNTKFVAMACGDGIQVWELSRYQAIWLPYPHHPRSDRADDHVKAVAFANNNNQLAIAERGRVLVCDLVTRQMRVIKQESRENIASLNYSPDDMRLVGIETNWDYETSWPPPARTVVWDIRDGAPVQVIGSQAGPGSNAVFSADGSQVFSSSAFGDIERWPSTRLISWWW